MKNIILCGMMGCGKTTCANLLGTKLGRQVVDTDDLVVKKAGMSISELFAAQGEAAMRDLETQVARELSEKQDLADRPPAEDFPSGRRTESASNHRRCGYFSAGTPVRFTTPA